MKKKMFMLLLLFGVTCGGTALYANEAGKEAAAEQPGKWEKAGKEIGEASHAVGDAAADSSKKAWEATKEGSVEAWDATKEESTKAWDSTKEKSQELWEKGKAKVHEATSAETAPESPAPEVQPEAAAQ